MSYLVIARKWRPQTFDDVVGQEHVTRTLQNAIRTDRVAHAFLFCGMRGVGKTTAARLLAKALNCERGPTPTPCNECSTCREITAGAAVDVFEIDGASNRGINEVRQIIENVRYRPAKSRFKVYIIDEVHQVTHDAFNALLKTLEEPPPHVKFILATTEAHKVPHTIVSRCQRYDFKRIAARPIAERLQLICDTDGISASESALLLVAREADGSMRDAQSLLDQVIAYAGTVIRDEDVIAALGVADRQILYAVASHIVAHEPAAALERLGELHLFGYDLRRFARELLEHFRNVAVARWDSSDALLPDLSSEERAEVRRHAEQLAGPDADRAFHIMLATEEEIGRSLHPKLILELAVIKLATLTPVVPIDEVLERLGSASSGGSAPRSSSSPPPASPPAATPSRSAATPARSVRAATPPEVEPAPPPNGDGSWDAFLAFVGKEKHVLLPHLQQCPPATVAAGRLELHVPRGFHHDYLARRDHLEIIERLATAFFGAPTRVGIHAASAGAAPAKPAPVEKAQLAKDALGDPAVRAVVDILGGEIHDVKSKSTGE